jgi:hypothetical protein
MKMLIEHPPLIASRQKVEVQMEMEMALTVKIKGRVKRTSSDGY